MFRETGIARWHDSKVGLITSIHTFEIREIQKQGRPEGAGSDSEGSA